MKIVGILQKKLPVIGALLLVTLYFLMTGDVSTPAPSTIPISPTPEARHSGTIATVVDVIDGDTIKVEGGEIVRYIGMNTPETVDPRKPVECFGKEASAKNKELVQGKVVELEKDISERDSFGRLLRYVWVGDTLMNETLVREGYAYVSTYPPDVKYEARLLDAQRLAREEKRGLSSGCPIATPTRRPVPAESTPSASPALEGMF